MSELSRLGEWRQAAPGMRPVRRDRKRGQYIVIVAGVALWCSIAVVLGVALVGAG